MMRPWYPILALLALATLAACGFQLRGGGGLPAAFGVVELRGGGAVLRRELGGGLRAAGAVVVDGESGAGSNDAGAAVIRVLDERDGRRTLSVDSAGKALKYGVYYEVEFDALGADGAVLARPRRLRLLEEYIYDGDDVHGAEREEQLLRRAMVAQAAARIIRRLQAAAPAAATPR